MIAAVRGIVEDRGPDWLLVGIGGVSLRVAVPASTATAAVQPGEEIRLHTHLHIREDAVALYGFLTAEARDAFVLLLGVAGVGPRGALALLSALGPAELARAVETEDRQTLQQAPGLGPRTAERVIVELRGKVDALLGAAPGPARPQGRDELLDALLALGYTMSEARRTLASLGDTGEASLEERLKEALQALGRG